MIFYRFFQHDIHRWIPTQRQEPKRITHWSSIQEVQAARQHFLDYILALPVSDHSCTPAILAHDFLLKTEPSIGELDLINAPQILLGRCRVSEHCVPDTGRNPHWHTLNSPRYTDLMAALHQRFACVHQH